MRDILHFAETARKKTILPFCVKQFAELEIFCILLAERVLQELAVHKKCKKGDFLHFS